MKGAKKETDEIDLEPRCTKIGEKIGEKLTSFRWSEKTSFGHDLQAHTGGERRSQPCKESGEGHSSRGGTAGVKSSGQDRRWPAEGTKERGELLVQSEGGREVLESRAGPVPQSPEGHAWRAGFYFQYMGRH